MAEKKEKQGAAKGAGLRQPKGGWKGRRGGGGTCTPATVVPVPEGGGERGDGGEWEGGGAKVGSIRHRGDNIQGGSTFALCHRCDSKVEVSVGPPTEVAPLVTRQRQSPQCLLPAGDIHRLRLRSFRICAVVQGASVSPRALPEGLEDPCRGSGAPNIVCGAGGRWCPRQRGGTHHGDQASEPRTGGAHC